MEDPIDVATQVGSDQGIWNISARSKSNPLDDWFKEYADRADAQQEAYSLGLIQRDSELLQNHLGVANWYHKTGETSISTDLLEQRGFTRRRAELNYRVLQGSANVGGRLNSQNRVALPRLGETINAVDTGLGQTYAVKSISGPFITGRKITFLVELY